MEFQTTSEAIFNQSAIIHKLILAKHDEDSNGIIGKVYLKLLSSIDVIEDCQCAIDCFKKSVIPSTFDSYLYIYGLLQVLVVQQNAINSIATALDPDGSILSLCQKEFETLAVIRSIRNDVAGHPTDRGGDKDNRFIRLIRGSIRKESFSYNVIGDEIKTCNVDVNQMIDSQECYIHFCLSKIYSHLKGIEPEVLLQQHLNCK